MYAHWERLAEMSLDDASPETATGPRELAVAQVSALQGIGYALLAAGDRLSAVLDAAGDRNTQLERIAEAVEVLYREPRRTPWRWLRAGVRNLAWRLRGARAARAWRAQIAAPDGVIVRQALADAAAYRRQARPAEGCADCAGGRRLCPEHAHHDEVLARGYTRVLDEIQGHGNCGAMRRCLPGFLRRHPDAAITVTGAGTADAAGGWSA